MYKEIYVENNGKIKILHSAIIDYLGYKGFMNLVLNGTKRVLVRMEDNLISESSVAEAVEVARDYIKSLNKPEVYEAFVRGMGSYISHTKLNLLKSITIVDDRDDLDTSVLYFRNGHVNVSKEGIEFKSNDVLEKPIWRNRVIDFDFKLLSNPEKGQFERFCEIVSKNDESRFRALKTFVGYILHRNRLRGETKAIILYDEHMDSTGSANGGTGKTLLTQAIAKCREVVTFDGKNIKAESWFKNQRIELTTDVMVYDDLSRNVSLEGFYSILTDGIEVEKKRQQSFKIPYEESPKIIITANQPVKGTGGSSDRRRRYEFELANYFSAELTPEMVFGNRFFQPFWSEKQWNLFYRFMLECIREYLIYGLVEADSLNLQKSKQASLTNPQFAKYFQENAVYNEWVDKSEFKDKFLQQYPEYTQTSSHQVTKWIDSIAKLEKIISEHKSSGGKSVFMLCKANDRKEDHGK